jgi:hypothetical protein
MALFARLLKAQAVQGTDAATLQSAINTYLATLGQAEIYSISAPEWDGTNYTVLITYVQEK